MIVGRCVKTHDLAQDVARAAESPTLSHSRQLRPSLKPRTHITQWNDPDARVYRPEPTYTCLPYVEPGLETRMNLSDGRTR